VERIPQSLVAMILAVAACLCYAFSGALSAWYFVTLSVSSLVGNNLSAAGSWMLFVAAAIVFFGLCAPAWEAVLARQWVSVAEACGAAVGALVLAIGLLIDAASAASAAGSVVPAVGIGIWALLALARAGRMSLLEQESSRPRQASLWLISAFGMFASAIGYGLTASTGTGALVALAVLLAAGLAALGVSVGLARMRGLVTSRATRGVLAGVAALAASCRPRPHSSWESRHGQRSAGFTGKTPHRVSRSRRRRATLAQC
jgi:hypothetical protein